LAVAEKIPVQQIQYSKLKDKLVALKQNLSRA